jgi:pimeloyl-ACP methyl ester carboxylesterase
LKTDVEFDFIDAPFEDAPAPGIENFFKPPYFVWNRFYAPPKVSEVHKYVREIVAREANHKYPYDGVIGFSEGAALAAALLLEDASNPDQWCAPIFKIAVFINAVNIVSPSTTLGKKMHESDMQHAMDTFTRADDKHHSPALDCVYALCSNTVPALITIPTLHIVGTKDYFRESSEDLVKLCERGTATVVRSTAGHEMPRDQKLKEMAGQLDKMIKAELMST